MMRLLSLSKKGHFSRLKFPQHQRYQASSWTETLIVREHRDPNRNDDRKKSCSPIIRRQLLGLPSRSNPRSKSLLRINLHPMLPHLMSPLDIRCKGEPLLAATISNFNAGKSSVMPHPDSTQDSAPLVLFKLGFYRKHNIGVCSKNHNDIECHATEAEWLKLVPCQYQQPVEV